MMSRGFSIWTIYDHPTDFPSSFVARRWNVGAGNPDPQPTAEVIVYPSLEAIRDRMREIGLTCVVRSEDNDDPCIVESWL